MATTLRTTVRRYTPAEFLAVAERDASGRGKSYGNSWCGGHGWDETIAKARFGDESLVPKAEEVLERISEPVSAGLEWGSTPFGAYPVVPEFLAGHPDPMRSRRRVENEAQPVTVYASILASAAFNADVMTRRGVAMLALLMRLQRTRPVDLKLVMSWTSPERVLVVDVESRPVCVATAAYSLAHPSFFRRLGHATLFGEWSDRGSSPMDEARTRQLLGLGPEDLYLHSLVWGEDELTLDPIGWINRTVERYENGEES